MNSLLIILFLFFSYDRSDWIVKSAWTKTRKSIVAKSKQDSEWICFYSGYRTKNSSEFDLDHVIPLKYANEHCGDTFSIDKKHKFATDFDNLILVYEKENRRKGDKGILNYLPKLHRCSYLMKWDFVTNIYGICLEEKERKFLNQELQKCEEMNGL